MIHFRVGLNAPNPNGYFDIVIGNPPYLDSEHMVIFDLDKRELYSSIYESAVGNWDLFIPFVEKGIKLVKQYGITSFIIPNKIISQDYAKKIREIIMDKHILEIRDYSRQDVFPIADVYPITILLKNDDVKKFVINMTTMQSMIQIEKTNIVSNDIMRKYQWDIFFCSPSLSAILIKMASNECCFSDLVCFSSPCTVNEAYIIKEILQNSNILTNDKKLINSGTIDKYLSKWGIKNTSYIKEQYLHPIVSNNSLLKMSKSRYEQSLMQKIIVANMTTDLEAFIDTNGEYLAGKSTVIGIGDYQQLLYLTGLLNSKLISIWYKSVYNSTKMKGGALSVTYDRLNDIPIPIDNSFQQSIITIVNKILSMKQENPHANIIKLEKEIDKQVYGLYGLTKEEIEIIDG